MARLILAACVGAAAYILLRPPRDDPLDDFDYAPPPVRAAPPPAPPPAATKPAEPAPAPQQPVRGPAIEEPIDALLLGILRFVGLQIFISVLVVLAVSLFLGAENGRTVGIGAFGIFSVFTFSALAQMRLQVGVPGGSVDALDCSALVRVANYPPAAMQSQGQPPQTATQPRLVPRAVVAAHLALIWQLPARCAGAATAAGASATADGSAESGASAAPRAEAVPVRRTGQHHVGAGGRGGIDRVHGRR